MNLGVTVQPIEEKTEKIGNIIIPNSVEVKKKFKSGIVKSTGRGTEDRPMEVAVGDKVMYKNNEYPLDENGFDVVHLEDILYVI